MATTVRITEGAQLILACDVAEIANCNEFIRGLVLDAQANGGHAEKNDDEGCLVTCNIESKVSIDRSSLESAVIDYLESVDSMQCHIHLRINADGTSHCDQDASYCVSEAEFNKTEGHAKTVKHQQGHGQCNLSDDWTSTDEGIEEIAATIDAIVEDLERDGFEVELV
jgi:hypothetical protein